MNVHVKEPRTISLCDNELIVFLLQAEIVAFMHRGGKINLISKVTKVKPETVSNLAYGKTRSPRLEVVVPLLHFFGYGITLTRQ